MKRQVAVARAALVVALVFAPTPVRAELVPWSYSWSRSPADVAADAPGTGRIILSEQPLPQNVVGDSFIVATNIRTESSAMTTPDTFTNAGYSLSLHIVDGENGLDGSLTFSGAFSGQLTAASANITNQFTGDTTQQLTLGQHRYTVTIGPFSPPGPPSSTPGGVGPAGAISAYAQVTIETLPEPGTLLLAALGAPLLGWFGWRRRANSLAG